MRLKSIIPICFSFACSLSVAAPIFKQPLHPIRAGEAGPVQFEILRLITKLEDKPPTLVETQSSLRVDDRRFSLAVTIRYTIPDSEQWSIGIIQQIDTPLINSCEYSMSILDWELPELPYCDTSAKSDAPWPGDLSYRTVTGAGTTEVFTGDHLVNVCTWAQPLPPKGEGHGPRELLSVNRSGNFTDWLVACRESDGAVVVLKRIRWGSSFKITVQPEGFLGERATLVEAKSVQPTVENVSDSDALTELSTKVLSGGEVSNLDMEWWSISKGETSGDRVRLR